MRDSFQLLHCQTWGQGLLQLLCLLFVCDDQGVKVSVASNFKLHIILIFLYLDRLGVLSPGCEQKVLDFLNFARHGDKAWRAWLEPSIQARGPQISPGHGLPRITPRSPHRARETCALSSYKDTCHWILDPSR